MYYLIKLKNYLLSFIKEVGNISIFTLTAIYWAFKPPFFFRETFENMRKVGYQCLLPVLAVVGPTGMVMALQSIYIFDIFGAHRLLSSLLAESMFRELCPTLASIMIAAQAGSSIAGEIGTMRVKEEIDALEIMSVNPFQYLIIPRFLALAIMCPLINIIASVTGIFGGYVVAVLLKGLNHGTFMANLFGFLQLSHIWGGMLKASVFGLVIGILSCYKGYNVTGGALGVGRAANTTVVDTILVVVCLNYFLTSALISIMG